MREISEAARKAAEVLDHDIIMQKYYGPNISQLVGRYVQRAIDSATAALEADLAEARKALKTLADCVEARAILGDGNVADDIALRDAREALAKIDAAREEGE